MIMTPEKEAELRGLLEHGELPWVLSGVRVKWRASYSDHMMDSHAIGPDDTKGAICLVPYDERNHARDYGYARLIHAAVNALPDLLSAISTEREGRERAEAELQRRNQNVGWQLIYQAMELWRKAFRDDDLAVEGMVVADKGWADPPEGEYWTVRSTISPKAAGVAPYGHVKAYTRDPNVAALLTFISTALPQLCELRPDEKAEAQISALQALIAEKDAALRPFAEAAQDYVGPFAERRYEEKTGVVVRVTTCIQARTALNSTEAKTGGEA